MRRSFQLMLLLMSAFADSVREARAQQARRFARAGARRSRRR